MRVVTVARKPLSEPSVAANVLKHGTGALNIDACRVTFTSDADAERHAQEWDREYNQEANSSPIHTWDKAIGNHPGDKRGHGGGPRETGGRWPANLVLQHRPGCQRVGIKKVKASLPASGPTLTGRSHSPALQGGYTGISRSASHGDEDGTETVEAWECVPGCPVVDLDRQSDTNGVSRFFKTVKGER